MNRKRVERIVSGTVTMMLLCCLTAGTAPKDDTATYIRRYSDLAVEEMYRSGIPASIILGQAILESASGKSVLATKGNNHFAIKCHNWKGEKIYRDDDNPNDCFRKYKSPEESYRDHSDFLRYNDRYKFLFDLDPTDYKAWCYGLKKAGYATDPDYAPKLIAVIEKNELYRFDGGTADGDGSGAATGKDSEKKDEKVSSGTGKGNARPMSPAQIETPKPLDSKQMETFSFNLSRKMYSLNGVAFVYADKGDSYSSIAREFHLFKKEILRFNDLNEESELNPGDIIYLQKKKNGAAKDLDKHVWTEGDDLWKLSQRYAVRLSSLRKLNKGVQDFEEGDLVLLR
ncbi:MAG: glucosaminidase domain-containing protein [Candidatus Cryptobacteroides sp.]